MSQVPIEDEQIMPEKGIRSKEREIQIPSFIITDTKDALTKFEAENKLATYIVNL